MTIDDLRKTYPFIGYGTEWSLWKKNGRWYKWLLDRLYKERPTEGACHEMFRVFTLFAREVEARNKIFETLQKPTKEQKQEVGIYETAEWPDAQMDDIRKFCEVEAKCWNLSRQAAAALAENDYRLGVLLEKTYDSLRERQRKTRKKRRNS